MRKQHFGTAASVTENSIVNLSKYDLSDTDKFVLVYGLEFGLPFTKISRKEVFAEFKVLIGQLLHHTPKSKENVSALTAKLNNLAHSYCNSPIGWTDFFMHRECFQAMKSLRSNKDILITKPDKGSRVVILNGTDYIAKMEIILCDSKKFICLGPVEEYDNTAKLETKLQRQLLQLKKDDQITPSIYNDI